MKGRAIIGDVLGNDFDNILKKIEALSKDPNADPAKILETKRDALKALLEIEEKVRKRGTDTELFANTDKTFGTMINELKQLLALLPEQVTKVDTAQTKRNDLLLELKVTEAQYAQAIGALSVFADQFRHLIPALEEANDTAKTILQATENIIKAAGAVGVGGKALGGMLGFAPGGLLRGGTGRDNKAFMGHDGEFVMNSESTRKFYPQLVAMNSGGNNSGGHSSVTNVGDISVNLSNVNGNNPQQSVVEIGRLLRRAIKTGNVKL